MVKMWPWSRQYHNKRVKHYRKTIKVSWISSFHQLSLMITVMISSRPTLTLNSTSSSILRPSKSRSDKNLPTISNLEYSHYNNLMKKPRNALMIQTKLKVLMLRNMNELPHSLLLPMLKQLNSIISFKVCLNWSSYLLSNQTLFHRQAL